jgi:hypothetical protein
MKTETFVKDFTGAELNKIFSKTGTQFTADGDIYDTITFDADRVYTFKVWVDFSTCEVYGTTDLVKTFSSNDVDGHRVSISTVEAQ